MTKNNFHIGIDTDENNNYIHHIVIRPHTILLLPKITQTSALTLITDRDTITIETSAKDYNALKTYVNNEYYSEDMKQVINSGYVSGNVLLLLETDEKDDESMLSHLEKRFIQVLVYLKDAKIVLLTEQAHNNYRKM